MTTRKWGAGFTVNTTTAGQQDQSAVAALSDGGFMVIWRDDGPADSLIRAQRYDARGIVAGTEITLSTNVGDQSAPDLVQLQDGTLWATYTDFDTLMDDDADGQIMGLSGNFIAQRARQRVLPMRSRRRSLRWAPRALSASMSTTVPTAAISAWISTMVPER